MRNNPTQQQLNRLSIENALWPKELKCWSENEWPPTTLPVSQRPVECWRSKEFLLQVFAEKECVERLSVCKTSHDVSAHRFTDGISWDDLQRLKAECGRGEFCAVEVYPPDHDLVNVANMRHLFILHDTPAYVWRKK